MQTKNTASQPQQKVWILVVAIHPNGILDRRRQRVQLLVDHERRPQPNSFVEESFSVTVLAVADPPMAMNGKTIVAGENSMGSAVMIEIERSAEPWTCRK